jgi:hypothetical protein
MTCLRQKKFKGVLSAEKITATVILDQKGVILVNFLPLYWNTKNSESLLAMSSPHKKNVKSVASP